MGRLLAIDYGRRRCGIAVTDVMRIVATGLTTVPTSGLIDFVRGYVGREPVDAIIVGLPRDVHGRESESMRYITPGIGALRKALPGIRVEFYDERFTSVIAHRSMARLGHEEDAAPRQGRCRHHGRGYHPQRLYPEPPVFR